MSKEPGKFTKHSPCLRPLRTWVRRAAAPASSNERTAAASSLTPSLHSPETQKHVSTKMLPLLQLPVACSAARKLALCTQPHRSPRT